MKTVPFGPADAVAPNVVAGMMRINSKSDEQIRELYAAARDADIDFFDHADIYGDHVHHCETRFAEALSLSASERDEITIQTKCGIVKDAGGVFDFSYDHIIRQVEGSLKALKTDYIDVLLLHRPDALVEPQEVARAFDELERSGKVRSFGVSNHTAGQIELLRSHVEQKFVANQLQLSIAHGALVTQGLAANMMGLEQSSVLDGGGLLEYCRINEITIQAWSPLQHGMFRGVFLGSDEFPELNAEIDRLAAHYGVEPIAIAVAWITRHPAGMQVVLGTTTPSRLTAAAAGSDVYLTREEWYGLTRAAGHQVP